MTFFNFFLILSLFISISNKLPLISATCCDGEAFVVPFLREKCCREFQFFVGPHVSVRSKSRTLTDRDQPQRPQLWNKWVTITTDLSRRFRERRELLITGVRQNAPFGIISANPLQFHKGILHAIFHMYHRGR